VIAFAVALAASRSRSATATFAPSRAYTKGMSLPMALAAPVTTADLSVKLMATDRAFFIRDGAA
jgi:hypothetical protein